MADPTSCIPKPPFIELDPAGVPAILNYSLPQSTCFDSKGYLLLKISSSCFKTETLSPPTVNLWDTIAGSTQSDLVQLMNDDVLGVASPAPVFTNPHYFQTQQILNTTHPINQTNIAGKSNLLEKKSSLDETAGNSVAGFDASDIVKQLEKGHRPIIIRQFSGKPRILFLPRPKTPTPTIAIVLHYKTCSYLGNYGAGKTLKSFSLLPGEKTTISIKTYKQTEETKKKSENILDSFSESSADDLQTYVEEMSTKDKSLDLQLILALKAYADLTIQLTPKNKLAVVAENVLAENSSDFHEQKKSISILF